MSNKSLEYQQQYRQIFGDIVAGFSFFDVSLGGEIETFFIKHLKEMDYGRLEKLGDKYLQEARGKGLLTEKRKAYPTSQHGTLGVRRRRRLSKII